MRVSSTQSYTYNSETIGFTVSRTVDYDTVDRLSLLYHSCQVQYSNSTTLSLEAYRLCCTCRTPTMPTSKSRLGILEVARGRAKTKRDERYMRRSQMQGPHRHDRLLWDSTSFRHLSTDRLYNRVPRFSKSWRKRKGGKIWQEDPWRRGDKGYIGVTRDTSVPIPK